MMRVVAHRGSSGSAPENTLSAFHAAAADGAALIECDVRWTRDLVPVILHDRTVRRTSGERGRVHELTAQSIAALDAGRWFHRRFTGERIPFLAETLASLPLAVGLNIEVKIDGDPRPRTRLAESLLRTLHEHAGSREIIVSSFNHRFLRVLRALDRSLPLGVLYMPVRDFGRLPHRLAQPMGASLFICSRSQLRAVFVRDAHAHGMHVAVYGVNHARHLRRPVRFGVDMIITDYPADIAAAIRKERYV